MQITTGCVTCSDPYDVGQVSWYTGRKHKSYYASVCVRRACQTARIIHYVYAGSDSLKNRDVDLSVFFLNLVYRMLPVHDNR